MKATDIFLILWYIVMMGCLLFAVWNMWKSRLMQKADLEATNQKLDAEREQARRRMQEIHAKSLRLLDLQIERLERDARDPGRPWE